MVILLNLDNKLQFIGGRGCARALPLTRLETFWKKFLRTSKTFKKGIKFTNLVLKNGETMPFSIVKWLLFQLSYVKLFAKLFLEKACRRRHATSALAHEVAPASPRQIKI